MTGLRYSARHYELLAEGNERVREGLPRKHRGSRTSQQRRPFFQTDNLVRKLFRLSPDRVRLNPWPVGFTIDSGVVKRGIVRLNLDVDRVAPSKRN